jgi:hypothetical protein
LPSGLFRDRASDAGRKRPVTRHHDAAWLSRVLEYVVPAAVALNPAVARKPCDNLASLDLGLLHGSRSIVRKYWRTPAPSQWSSAKNFQLVYRSSAARSHAPLFAAAS